VKTEQNRKKRQKLFRKMVPIVLILLLAFVLIMCIKPFTFPAYGEIKDQQEKGMYSFEVYDESVNANKLLNNKIAKLNKNVKGDKLARIQFERSNFSKEADVKIEIKNPVVLVGSDSIPGVNEITENMLNLSKDHGQHTLLRSYIYNNIMSVPTNQARSGTEYTEHFQIDYLVNASSKTGTFYITRTGKYNIFETIYKDFLYTLGLQYEIHKIL